MNQQDKTGDSLVIGGWNGSNFRPELRLLCIDIFGSNGDNFCHCAVVGYSDLARMFELWAPVKIKGGSPDTFAFNGPIAASVTCQMNKTTW